MRLETGKLVYILDLIRAQKTLARELRILILVLQVLFNRCSTAGSPLYHWIISLKRHIGKVNVELASGPVFNIRGMAKSSRTRIFYRTGPC